MPLTFAGTTLNGVVETLDPGEVEAKMQSSSPAGQEGETTIYLGKRGRRIQVRIWMNGFNDAAALKTYLDGVLTPLVGAISGSLVLTGARSETYADCHLEYWQPVSSGRGPLPNNDTKWHLGVDLQFRKKSFP